MAKTIHFPAISFIFVLILGGLNAEAKNQTCTYTIDPASRLVEWQAFKTTQRMPVKGSFPKVNFQGKLSASGKFKNLLSQQSADLTVDSETKLSTGNGARDLTLFKHFFSLFKDKAKIHASIQKVVEGVQAGSFELKLKMNQKTLSIPMQYEYAKDGRFNAKGEIDVLNFGLESALGDLHKTCEVLHQGPDKVSKTWPNVEIHLSAVINETCK